jgi:urease accessory protein UreF
LQSASVDAQNSLAWILAASPDALIRNGPKALNLAQRAQQLLGKSNPKILRTLAASYAESGRFQEAIDTARSGSDLASAQGNTALVRMFETDLALDRTNTPLVSLTKQRNRSAAD